MLDVCLKNQIIYDFLNNYNQKKWNNIIPSLLEIAILNLYSSFKRYIFSEEDFSLIIDNLKTKCSLPTKSIKGKKSTNNNFKEYNYKEKLDIDIPKFRRNLKLNMQDYLKGRNDSYRSFTKKPKNINELNVYKNNIIDNSRKQYCNRSSALTPIKDLINYNETDISIDDNKNIYRIKNNINKNKGRKININNNINKKIILYNTIEHYDANNKFQNLFNISNNTLNTHNNNNINMNYSYSLNEYKENKKKNYIKVNKNKNNNNNNLKLFVNGEETLAKKNNKYYSITEINNKTMKINKMVKLKIFNDYKKKQKKNFNFNKEKILKKKEVKNNLNVNSINYNREKNHIKNNMSKTSNNSILCNSPQNNFEFKGISKLQKYINNHNQININKNNLKEMKNHQIASIKKNLKEIILNREKRKDNRKNYSSNKDALDDINKSISNMNDTNISYTYGNNNMSKMNEQGILLIKNNKKEKKIINYNSFNNSKNSKHSISLNDPFLFIKSPRITNFVFGKQNKSYANANGSIEK